MDGRADGLPRRTPAHRPYTRRDGRLPRGWSAHAPHPRARLRAAMNDTADCTPVADEPPVDGIRWDLVNRMKKLIAAGELDTPERWVLAEEFMFRAVDPPTGRD
jgi:hypothetical protein